MNTDLAVERRADTVFLDFEPARARVGLATRRRATPLIASMSNDKYICPRTVDLATREDLNPISLNLDKAPCRLILWMKSWSAWLHSPWAPMTKPSTLP